MWWSQKQSSCKNQLIFKLMSKSLLLYSTLRNVTVNGMEKRNHSTELEVEMVLAS